MKRFCLFFVLTVFVACHNENVEYLGDVAQAPIQNGLQMIIGVPRVVHEGEIFSSEDIRIEVINVSMDTIFFAHHFVFEDDHPVWGNFSFHINDQDGHNYPSGIISRHYSRIVRSDTEYITLPPRASYLDTITISLQGDYSLERNKTYSMHAKYFNERSQTTGVFPKPLSPGKQLWTGVLRSNTYQFRITD